MDESEEEYGEQLHDPKERGTGNTDILKINIGRQMDRINRAFDQLNDNQISEFLVFRKAATHIRILDSMIYFKTTKKYKYERDGLMAKIEKFEDELTDTSLGVMAWHIYLAPLTMLYALQCSELSNLGIVPYDVIPEWKVGSKEDDVDELPENSE